MFECRESEEKRDRSDVNKDGTLKVQNLTGSGKVPGLKYWTFSKIGRYLRVKDVMSRGDV